MTLRLCHWLVMVWPLAVMGDGGDVGRIRVAIAEGEVDDGAAWMGM
jgi:hypothetical protein